MVQAILIHFIPYKWHL